MVNIKSPVIICGCHGSGTSYVTKLLRWHGLYVGNDAGLITDRKLHESKVYTKTNEAILQTLTGGCTFGMRTTDPEEWERYFSNLKDDKKVEEAFGTVNLWKINRKYWGGRKIVYPLWRIVKSSSPWGWKDPRNSITLPFWMRIYKKPKILVLTKEWVAGKTGSSGSGRWFKEESTDEIRNIYMNPPGLRDLKVDSMFFDFSHISDRSKLNEMMTWVGLPAMSRDAYNKLLDHTEYDRTS